MTRTGNARRQPTGLMCSVIWLAVAAGLVAGIVAGIVAPGHLLAQVAPPEARVTPARVSVEAGQATEMLNVEVQVHGPLPDPYIPQFSLELPRALQGHVTMRPDPVRVRVPASSLPHSMGRARFRLETNAETPAGSYRVALVAGSRGELRAEFSVRVTAPPPPRRPEPPPSDPPKPRPEDPPPPPSEPPPPPEPPPSPPPEPPPQPEPPPPPVEPVDPGDFEVQLRQAAVELCDEGAPAAGALVVAPLRGYRGTPRLTVGALPPGLTVTPSRLATEPLPPRRTVPFEVSAQGTGAGTFRVELRAEDPAHTIAHRATLTVRVETSDFTPVAASAALSLRQGAPAVTLRLLVRANRCFTDAPVAVRIEGAPAGLVLERADGSLLPPGFAEDFSLRALPTLPTGTYPLTARFTDANGRSRTLDVLVHVVPPGAGEILRSPRIDRIMPAELIPGEAYRLEIQGRNLRPGVAVSFGPDIQVIGQPVFRSEAAGTISVRVLPGVAPGSRIARVESEVGVSEGPGAVLIRSATHREPVPDRQAPAPPPEPRPSEDPVEPPRVPPRSMAPRVDQVSPADVVPGLTYTLLLEGRSFAPDMQIDFGAGIDAEGPLTVESPWRAAVTIQVAEDSSAGARPVAAWDERGRSEGPAELTVQDTLGTALPLPPEFPWLATPAIGIELLQPHAPNAADCSGPACRPPVLTENTVFTWRETNPGVAETFLLEIVDAEGEVLASAQASQPRYQVTSPFLAALPRIDDAGSWAGPALLAAVSNSAIASAGVIQTLALPEEEGAGMATLEVLPLQALALDTGWQQLPGAVWWRVTGFRSDLESSEMEEVGRSEERGLLLPLPPTGLGTCDAAPSGSSVRVTQRAPAPGSDLTEICSRPGLDPLCADSIVTLGGVVDVSRSPYPLGMIGAPPGPVPQLGPSILFRNLLIDWGDGSAPKPLSLLAAAAANPERMPLVGPTGGGLRHHYRKPGTYTARIYALANPEQDLPQSIALMGLHLAQANQSDYQFLSQRAGGRLGEASLPSAEGGEASAPSPEDAFLVSCTQVQVEPDPDAGRDGPLDLISAEIEWPPPYTDQDPAQVVECSESFRPRVRIVYSGRGRVRLTWHRVGEAYLPIETSSPAEELPGVSFVEAEAGSRPAYFELEANLPLFVRDEPFRLRVTVEDASVTPSGPGVNLAGNPGQTPMGELGLTVGSDGAPSGILSVDPVLIAVVPLRRTEAVSPIREYVVVPVPDGQPCRLRYDTTESGTLFITDLALSDAQGGSAGTATLTGTGMLGVRFPDGAGGVMTRHLPVTFSQWQVERGETGADWPVTSGALSASPDLDLPVAGFTLGVTSLALNPEHLAIDGALELGPSQNLLHPQGGWNRVTFPFTGAVIEPAGGFYHPLSDLNVQAQLGNSGFRIVFRDVTLDLSLTRGVSLPPQPPPGVQPNHPLFIDWMWDMACAAQPFGPAWIGVSAAQARIEVPTFQFTAFNITLPGVDIGQWRVGPSGSAARVTRQLGQTANIGPVGAQFNHLDLRSCHGSFSARLSARLTNLPIVETLGATLRFDEGGGVTAQPHPLKVSRDYGVARFDVTRALFERADDLGTWVVDLDAVLQLQLNPERPVFSQTIHGLRVGLNGRLYPPAGLDTWFPVNVGKGNLAGFGIDVSQIGIGWQGGSAWFGLSAGLELSNVFELRATRLTFRLQPQGAGYKPAGVQVDDISFSSQFPSANPTAKLSGSVGWASGGGSYRFHGEGGLRIADSLGIDVGVLFGRQQSSPYWLARAAVALPAPIPLGPTPLTLRAFQGGLGQNVSLDSYQKPLAEVTPQIGAGVSVMAGVGIAYTTDYYFYLDGSLAMQFSGPGAGFRVDAEAWVLNSSQPPKPKPAPLHACVRLSGGQFTVAAGADLSILGGAVRVKAPSGPDPCTSPNAAISLAFGPQGQWHMYFGRKATPVSVRAFARDTAGYLELAPGAFGVGASIGRSFGPYRLGSKCWNVYAEGGFSWGADFALQVNPLHLYGSANAQAHLAIGACGACNCGSISVGFGLIVSAEAPNPTRVCIDELWVNKLIGSGTRTLARNRCLG